jgi:phosphocarrier protein FPr
MRTRLREEAMNFLKKIFTKQQPVTTTLTITSNNGFHLRPIAQFANEAKKYTSTVTIIAYEQEVSATEVPKILSLSLEKGESFILKCTGEDAKKATESLSNFFNQLMKNDKQIEQLVQEEEQYEAPTLNGVSVSPGVAIAPLAIYEKIEERTNSNKTTLFHAIEQSKKELLEAYEADKAKEESLIFLAQKELLSSELFEQQFKENLASKEKQIELFKSTILHEIDQLKGTSFESRISDYQDLEDRVLTHLGIENSLKLPTTPYILFAEDLLPSEIPKLNNTPIQGVVLKKGTPTSHASILLRSFAIPSVIIHNDICLNNPCNYPNTILDTKSGDLILEPTKEDIKRAEKKQEEFRAIQKQNHLHRFEPTQTLTGKPIKVLANIGDIESAKEAKELGADGVGLLRSEFLFSETKPTVEEQTQAYKEIFKLFDEVTIRTLDIGGDKALPYITIEHEENPFLGVRGIRFSLHEKNLLEEQLLAIFRANTQKKIKVMFPMVSNCEEFIEAKNIAYEVAKRENLNISTIQFGIMLEVPSVIFGLSEFDKLVDFYSIGTNDLTQYLFAIERTHPTLQANPISPMVMNALKMIIERTERPISICGELAGLGDATEELIEMGYSTLSVSARLIPSLKERIRHV